MKKLERNTDQKLQEWFESYHFASFQELEFKCYTLNSAVFWRARWVLDVPPRIGLSWWSVDMSHCSFNYMLFKSCGVVIHLCSNSYSIVHQAVSSLMISGTECGQCGEMLRNVTHRTQTASWHHINLFLQCHLISMCVPLFVCRIICIKISLNMSCKTLSHYRLR